MLLDTTWFLNGRFPSAWSLFMATGTRSDSDAPGARSKRFCRSEVMVERGSSPYGGFISGMEMRNFALFCDHTVLTWEVALGFADERNLSLHTLCSAARVCAHLHTNSHNVASFADNIQKSVRPRCIIVVLQSNSKAISPYLNNADDIRRKHFGIWIVSL